MARANSFLYEPWSTSPEPASSSSTGPTDIVTVTVPAGASGCYITVESIAARMTFSGVSPGNTTGPGQVFPVGAVPALVPIKSDAIKFVSASAGTSRVTFLFVK